MTTFYDVRIEVKDCPPEKHDALVEYLKAKISGADVEENEQEHSIEAQGGILIFGGETERAHEEIVKEVRQIEPDAKVVTRWHYGEWNWDDEYGEDEDCARLKEPEDFEQPEV